MQKLRVIILAVSIMPMVLNLIVYLLSKNKRFVKAFFGDETISETVWLPWLFVAVGWFLIGVVVSFFFDI